MADPLRDVSQGESLGRVFSASTFNMVMGATRAWRDNLSAMNVGGQTAGPGPDQLAGRLEVRVRAGLDLDQFAIVQLGDPEIDPEAAPTSAFNTPVFAASTPGSGAVD